MIFRSELLFNHPSATTVAADPGLSRFIGHPPARSEKDVWSTESLAGNGRLLFRYGQENRRGAVDLLGESAGRIRHHRNQVSLYRLSVGIGLDDDETGRHFLLNCGLAFQCVHRDALGQCVSKRPIETVLEDQVKPNRRRARFDKLLRPLDGQVDPL